MGLNTLLSRVDPGRRGVGRATLGSRGGSPGSSPACHVDTWRHVREGVEGEITVAAGSSEALMMMHAP